MLSSHFGKCGDPFMFLFHINLVVSVLFPNLPPAKLKRMSLIWTDIAGFKRVRSGSFE
jgi:hypothetical protein